MPRLKKSDREQMATAMLDAIIKLQEKYEDYSRRDMGIFVAVLHAYAFYGVALEQSDKDLVSYLRDMLAKQRTIMKKREKQDAK